MKKYIRKMSYIKTGDPINKSQPVSPLIIGTVRKWGNLSILGGDGMGFLAGIFKGGSEKGNTREHTGKRVTRWRNMFWGNLGKSR
jgi:hypothetical protein